MKRTAYNRPTTWSISVNRMSEHHTPMNIMANKLHFKRPSKLSYKLGRLMQTAKAPLNAVLCSLLVLCMTFLSTTWCCCLMGMHSQSQAVTTSQAPSAAVAQIVQVAQMARISSGDHSCCINGSPAQTTPSQSPAPSDDSKSCDCQGQVLDTPSHPATIHSVATASSPIALILPRLTASWQLPLPAKLFPLHQAASPPESDTSTLLAQACLLTV